MNTTLLTVLKDKLGPGLMFAAAAVGVSHLVQSTRAGAEYGLTLTGLIILTCLLKYPAYRFGSEYGALTCHSLLRGYSQQGKWVLVIAACVLVTDMMVATSAVALVTSGIFNNIYESGLSDIWLSFLLLISCAILLISGRYKLFENVTKVVVLLFTAIVILTTILAIPELNWQADKLGRPVVFDQQTIFFMIAIAGWMPTGMLGSVMLSVWVCEKSRLLNRQVTLQEAKFDFNVGYLGSMFLALCFAVIGTAIMFNSGISFAPRPVGFAAQLIGLFTQVIGDWIKPLITLAVFAVMFSTVITLMDACPRMAGRLISYIRPVKQEQEHKFYIGFIAFQVLGATLILVLFLQSFKLFIDFATSLAFISAPMLAYFNHRAMFSGDLEKEQQPSKLMYFWSLGGIIIMVSVAAYYLWAKLL